MDGYDVVNLISYQRLTRDQGYAETGISASRASSCPTTISRRRSSMCKSLWVSPSAVSRSESGSSGLKKSVCVDDRYLRWATGSSVRLPRNAFTTVLLPLVLHEKYVRLCTPLPLQILGCHAKNMHLCACCRHQISKTDLWSST